MAETYAHQIYSDLMDLSLLLQEGDPMVRLRMFMESADQTHPGLKKFHDEILLLKQHIEAFVAATR